MRKSILLFVIIGLGSFISAYAQNFRAGAFAGISTSQVSGDELAGFDKAGLYAGGFVNMPVGEKWLLQMEITYIMKGSRPTDKDIEYNPYMIYPTLNYAEVPIVFVYKVKPKLNIEGGAAFGVLVYSREEDSFSEIDIQRPYDDFDFSGVIGLDYFFAEKVSLNTRWINSVIPIREHESGQTYRANMGQYNTVIAFTLRWHF